MIQPPAAAPEIEGNGQESLLAEEGLELASDRDEGDEVNCRHSALNEDAGEGEVAEVVVKREHGSTSKCLDEVRRNCAALSESHRREDTRPLGIWSRGQLTPAILLRDEQLRLRIAGGSGAALRAPREFLMVLPQVLPGATFDHPTGAHVFDCREGRIPVCRKP